MITYFKYKPEEFEFIGSFVDGKWKIKDYKRFGTTTSGCGVYEIFYETDNGIETVLYGKSRRNQFNIRFLQN